MKADSKVEMKNRDEKRDAKSDAREVLNEKKTKDSADRVSESNKKSPRLQDIYRSLHR